MMELAGEVKGEGRGGIQGLGLGLGLGLGPGLGPGLGQRCGVSRALYPHHTTPHDSQQETPGCAGAQAITCVPGCREAESDSRGPLAASRGLRPFQEGCTASTVPRYGA